MALVQKIPRMYVAKLWPHVEAILAKTVPYSSGEFSLEQLKSEVMTGRWSLILVTEGEVLQGAIVYSYQNRMNSRVAFVHAIAGKGLANKDSFAQLKGVFSVDGATEIEGAVRPSIKRLWQRLGFSEKYSIVGVKL
jgi:hypothetical protein